MKVEELRQKSNEELIIMREVASKLIVYSYGFNPKIKPEKRKDVRKLIVRINTILVERGKQKK